MCAAALFAYVLAISSMAYNVACKMRISAFYTVLVVLIIVNYTNYNRYYP